jgi:hypothetical protein
MRLEFKEPAKFAAGGLEGRQGGVRLPAVRQGAYVLNGVEKKFGNREFPRGWGVVETPDDLASENPKIVDVFADGAAGKLELDQMIDKGEKTLHELFTERHVFGKAHPAAGPLVEILAAGQLIERKNGLRPVWGVRWGRRFLLTLLDNHGTDYDSKPMLPLFGVRL